MILVLSNSLAMSLMFLFLAGSLARPALAAHVTPGGPSSECIVTIVGAIGNPKDALYFVDPQSLIVVLVDSRAYQSGKIRPEKIWGGQMESVRDGIVRLSAELNNMSRSDAYYDIIADQLDSYRALDGSGEDGAWRYLKRKRCKKVVETGFGRQIPTELGNHAPFVNVETCVATLTLAGTMETAAAMICHSIVNNYIPNSDWRPPPIQREPTTIRSNRRPGCTNEGGGRCRTRTQPNSLRRGQW